MVIEFAPSVQPPEPNQQMIARKSYRAIRKTGFGDGTSLYEAVHGTIAKRLNGIEGRKGGGAVHRRCRHDLAQSNL
jgi:hypothetical protein